MRVCVCVCVCVCARVRVCVIFNDQTTNWPIITTPLNIRNCLPDCCGQSVDLKST